MTCKIPENFDTQGKVFNGMFEVRNVVEAGIYAYLCYSVVFKVLPIPISSRFICFAIICLPVAILMLVGIGGDSLVQKIMLVNKYRKRKRRLHYDIVFEEGNSGNAKTAKKRKASQRAKQRASGKKANRRRY